MQNFRDTILSQFRNSPTLGQLLASLNGYIDPTVNLDQFYDDLWNIETAVGYGLDVWGRIVGVDRLLITSPPDLFGFDEATPGAYTFGEGVLYNGGSLTSGYRMSDDAFRTVIRAKAAANICDGSIPAVNRILMSLFPGRGNCYVADNLDMTVTFTFTFPLSAVELAIVSTVLPRPWCGVNTSVVIV